MAQRVAASTPRESTELRNPALLSGRAVQGNGKVDMAVILSILTWQARQVPNLPIA